MARVLLFHCAKEDRGKAGKLRKDVLLSGQKGNRRKPRKKLDQRVGIERGQNEENISGPMEFWKFKRTRLVAEIAPAVILSINSRD